MTPGQSEHPSEVSPTSISRRRLIKGGLGAAPVIMTLSSRSAFAWHCKSPSGFVSGNASHNPVADEGTLSPQSWLATSSWPAPFARSGSTWLGFYTQTFDGNKFASGIINYQLNIKQTVTVRDVMQTGVNYGSGQNALGAYILAALLNLKKGKVPADCLTEAMLFKMFNDCATKGYYLPMGSSPTVQWSAQQVINYLRDNWLVG